MNTKVPILVAVVALMFVAGGCQATKERRPVSLREVEAPSGELSGKVAFVREGRVGESSLYVKDLSSGSVTEIPVPGSYVSSVELSSDGNLMAFASASGEGPSHIWIANVDGSGAKQITDGDGLDDYPSFSPDGSEIVFASTRSDDGVWSLYRMGVDGSSLKRLTSGSDDAVYPAWSPTGDRIAFASREDGGDYNLYLYDLTSGSTERLTDDGASDLFPDWAPSGDRLVFSSTLLDDVWQIYTLDLDTKEVVRLIGSDSVDRDPAYSPDGDHIVISTDHLAVYASDGEDLSDGKLRWRLTDKPALSPSWAP